MASVSKREWFTQSGERRIRFVATYIDQAGKERRHQFPTKREAHAERIRVEGALRRGTHVPDGITLRGAAERFLEHFEALYKKGKKQRSTYRAYEQHVRLHILE